jgi:hypothetical protein
MTQKEIQEALTDLTEVRLEIRRINKEAGRTVFNEAEFEMLNGVIEKLKEYAQ